MESDQAATRAFVRDLVAATITRPTSRDVQRMPGPSDLANPCDMCVGRKIASCLGMATDSNSSGGFSTSLKAWIGTAVHQKLEGDLPKIYGRGDRNDPNFYQEITVTIGDIPGLGTIKGHVDLYLPKIGTVVDYKTSDLRKINWYRSTTVPSFHAGQIMLYLRGLRRAQRRAHTAVLVYIPRDSNNIKDIWVASCSYQENIAIGLLNRTRNLVEVVRSGGIENLTSNADCYVCSWGNMT